MIKIARWIQTNMHFEREMRVESKMKPTMFSASSSAPSFIDELKGREKLTFQSRHLVQQCVKRNEQVRMRKEEDRCWGADRKKNQRLKRRENKWQTKCMKLLRSPSWQTGRWERRDVKHWCVHTDELHCLPVMRTLTTKWTLWWGDFPFWSFLYF